jgi:hypothetical protein
MSLACFNARNIPAQTSLALTRGISLRRRICLQNLSALISELARRFRLIQVRWL